MWNRIEIIVTYNIEFLRNFQRMKYTICVQRVYARGTKQQSRIDVLQFKKIIMNALIVFIRGEFNQLFEFNGKIIDLIYDESVISFSQKAVVRLN